MMLYDFRFGKFERRTTHWKCTKGVRYYNKKAKNDAICDLCLFCSFPDVACMHNQANVFCNEIQNEMFNKASIQAAKAQHISKCDFRTKFQEFCHQRLAPTVGERRQWCEWKATLEYAMKKEMRVGTIVNAHRDVPHFRLCSQTVKKEIFIGDRRELFDEQQCISGLGGISPIAFQRARWSTWNWRLSTQYR